MTCGRRALRVSGESPVFLWPLRLMPLRRRCLHVLEEGTHLRTAHSIIIWLSISGPDRPAGAGCD